MVDCWKRGPAGELKYVTLKYDTERLAPSVCMAHPCCHLTEYSEALPGEAKARLSPAGLTTLLGFCTLLHLQTRITRGLPLRPPKPRNNRRVERLTM